MELKSVRHNMIMNVILATSGLVIPLITYPYVTRVLSAEGLGKVAFASNVIFYFKLVAQLGVPTYGISQCAKTRDDKKALSKVITQLTAINVVTVAVAMIGLFFSILFFPTLNKYSLLLAINSIDLVFGTLNFEWLYKGLEQFDYITKRTLFCRVLTAGLTFILIRKEEDYYLYALLSVISSLFIWVLNIKNIHQTFSLRKSYLIKEDIQLHIKPILTLCATSLTTTIYTSIDVVMIGYLCGDRETGIYSVAIKIKTILVTVMTSIVSVYLPRMSKYYKDKDVNNFNKAILRSIQFVIMLAFPMVLFFIETSKLCINIISGEGYYAAVLPMQILMPTILLIGISSMVGTQVMVAMGRQKYQLRSTTIAAIVDIIINLLLIPKMGAAGAAIGTLAAELLVLILELYFIRDVFSRIVKKIQIKKCVISSIVALIIIKMISPLIEQNINNILFEFSLIFISYSAVYVSIMLVFKDKLFLEVLETVKQFFKVRKARRIK